MPVDWSAPEYATEGGEGESLPFIGHPVDAFFEDGPYGCSLRIRFARSDEQQVLHPNAKAEISWSWRTGPDWTTTDNGATITHPKADKAINANTDLGKMFNALKKIEGVGEKLPDGWAPTTAKSWRDLAQAGDLLWEWDEKPAMMPDPETPGRFIKNPDPEAKPKRTMLPVQIEGAGASNGQVEAFDISTLAIPDELLPLMQEAARGAGNADQLLANFAKVPGALQYPGIMQVLSDKPKAEAFRVSLGGSF